MNSIRIKTIMLLCFLLIINSFKATAQEPSKQEVYKDAEHWYALDENGVDMNGSINLSLYNIEFKEDATRGKVAVFSHADTSYMAAESKLISENRFTFAAWVYWDSSFEEWWQTIFEFGSSSGEDHIYLTPKGPDNSFGFVANSSAGWNSITAESKLESDKWTHIVLSYAEGNVTGFIDAKKVFEGNVATMLTGIDPQNFFFGVNPLPNRIYRTFEGKMDDIAIFDEILSIEQVIALANDTLKDGSTVVDSIVDTVSFTINLNTEYQTMHHFGASDAWSTEFIGENWPDAKKEDMAKKLFSQEFDNEGNPLGIGLSNWRFNIGDGSLDQEDSGYKTSDWFHETECFLQADGTYNWDKHAGARWFMEKAKNYGVTYFTGFNNSPPYFMTKNGYTFCTDEKAYNLPSSKLNDYADFLANVAKHFQAEGIPLNYISPINEPQWDWKSEIGEAAQAGSYATNAEIFSVVKALDNKLAEHKVNSKIIVTEAGAIDHLYKKMSDANSSDQVAVFWNSAGSKYLGNLEHVQNVICGHSYWTNSNISTSVNHRISLKNKLKEVGGDIEYWQTEYCLLGSDHSQGQSSMLPIDYSLWLARIIYTDIVEGDCAAWDFWTAISYPWGNDHRYRFGLINWWPTPYNKNTTNGNYEISKNLWALGNYSRFVRPGSKRVDVSRADKLNTISAANKQMVTAFNNNDEQLVVVIINYDDEDCSIDLNFNGDINGQYPSSFIPYTTSAAKNLSVGASVSSLVPILVEGKSIVTLVGNYDRNTSINEQVKSGSQSFKIYPNPTDGMLQLQFHEVGKKEISIYSLTGSLLKTMAVNELSTFLNLEKYQNGNYLITVKSGNKIMKQKITIK